MAKTQHRDTVDCLLAELKDAYEDLQDIRITAITGGLDSTMNWVPLDSVQSALAAIERAYQVADELKAAQS